ncbi:helix-turn-helix domain-containing protein [Rhodococcus sp. UNC363MFTsu5.1]|uniref:helix-turn-helix domain-containing protein n=1 Tax=Rhodococcus sp. UNC363MFTsu5.1 TaxID=1449069 RepID=UPI000485CF28|nr:helix-turn-helix domain-containing protein [Rhodococcus sp. UNC363MFTsu5.1]
MNDQPGSPRIGHAPPSGALAEYVERYWWCTTTGGGSLPDVWPGTGAELWIHLRGQVTARSSGPVTPIRLPAAHLVCLRRTHWSLTPPPGGAAILAVRFRAGSLRRLLPAGVEEVADAAVSAEDAWQNAGRRLADTVRSAPTGPMRIAAMDRALRALVANRPRERAGEAGVIAAADLVYRRRGAVRIDHLAAETGMSARQLQRRFPPAVGVGPKEFQRLTRIQHAARTLLLQDEPRYLATALDGGFYDQNHFIREFRQFTGRTPAAVLGRGMSHFYYESAAIPSQG